MKLRDIIEILEETYPLSSAAAWDNSGLQVGDAGMEVKKLYIALDATFEHIKTAREIKADLILTHHPLLMSGVKSVTSEYFHGRKILNLIKSGMAHYAMHTNFDVETMASLSATILGMEEEAVLEPVYVDKEGKEQGFGRVGSLSERMRLRELADLVKERFHIDHVRVFGDPERMVSRVAMIPGSGKSMMDAVLTSGAEVFLSGDFGHHDGLDACDQGLSVIDAGHYGLEHIFIDYMASFLKEKLSGVEVVPAELENIFHIF